MGAAAPRLQAALLFACEPAFAAWLAWYFLGETLDAQGWFGSIMILGASCWDRSSKDEFGGRASFVKRRGIDLTGYGDGLKE
ncbi:MAG: EamA family transporter [Nitrospiraceae bacterium]